MPLPAGIRTVLLAGTYVDLIGAPMAGVVTFAAKLRLRDPSDNVIVVPVDEAVTLDAAGGFEVTLPCTDDPSLSPGDWFYTVREDLKTPELVEWRRTFGLQLPTTLEAPPAVTQLADLVTIESHGGYGQVHGVDSVNGLTGAVTIPGSGPHTHAVTDVTTLATVLAGKADTTAVAADLEDKADLIHTHTIGVVEGLQPALDGKAALVHTHVIGDSTGLQAALDGKADDADLAAKANTVDVDTALAGKAATVHGHVEGDVTGLVEDLAAKADGAATTSALAGKAPTVHTHAQGDITDLVAALAALAPEDSPIFTGPVRVRMGAGLSFLVQSLDGSTTYFSVGDGAVNFNVPFGIYYFDLTGQRIYQGDADPDPGAPVGSRWSSPTGLRIRMDLGAGPVWVPIGPVNAVLAADVTNATTTPANITGLSLAVPGAGTYRFAYELFAETTVATPSPDVQWSAIGPTVSSVRMNARKLYLNTGPGAVFATAFGTLMATGTGIPANQPFKEVLEGTFIATAAGTLIPRVNLTAATATATVRALSTGTLTRIS